MTIGFNAVAALLSHRVAAVTAFWNDEGVTLQRRHPGYHIFRVDQLRRAGLSGARAVRDRAPACDENPGLARAVVRTLVRGYGVTLTDPEGSAADLQAQVPGLDPKLVSAQLAAENGAFVGPDGDFGELTLTTLRRWAQWEARFGIVRRAARRVPTFDPQFVAGTASLIGS